MSPSPTLAHTNVEATWNHLKDTHWEVIGDTHIALGPGQGGVECSFLLQ